MTKIVAFSQIVEANGKTIRENNMEIKHRYPIGTLVELELTRYDNTLSGAEINLKGICRLFIVSQDRDCDGTPLYTLSDLPVKYPDGKVFSPAWMQFNSISKLTVHGYDEQSFTEVGRAMKVYDNVAQFLGYE